MKNVIVILAVMLALGVVSYLGTMIIAQQMQMAARPVHAPTDDIDQEMANAAMDAKRAHNDLNARVGYALTGGSIGCVIGLLAGIGLVKHLEKERRKYPAPEPLQFKPPAD